MPSRGRTHTHFHYFNLCPLSPLFPPPRSVRSLLPKACLNTFRAVRALLSKPENCQLSLSYSDKASALLRDSLNLGPHCHSSGLDKVHTLTHTGTRILVHIEVKLILIIPEANCVEATASAF